MRRATSSLSARPVPSPGRSPGRHLPGLLLCAALAAAAVTLGRQPWLASHGFSALVVAIVLGMAVGNAVPGAWLARGGPGIAFAKQTLLRAGIVLYGLRLTLQDIGQVGASGVLIAAAVLVSTFGLAWLIGTRWLRMDRQTVVLIGAGSAICGAAAVLATEPVVRAEADQVTIAVSTVVVFGTLTIFLYPAIYRLGLFDALLPQGPQAFGIYLGASIHEVAQVVAAAQPLGAQAVDAAVIAKMVRVMLLAPFLVALSAWLSWRRGRAADGVAGRGEGPRLMLPWFAFLFVGVVVINSLVRWPPPVLQVAHDVDTLLLAMAMGALGVTTHRASLRRAGFKPMLLAAVLFAWLVLGGATISGAVMAWQ